ncbi:MAG: AMP-binding protein [Geminicoccaceae bacterium]
MSAIGYLPDCVSMKLPSLTELDTFAKLLLHNAANWPDDVAMREKDLGIWNAYSWADCRNEVRAIFFGLKSLGLERGEALAIIGRNRPNWVWSALAGHAAGAMSLGIYEDVLPNEAGYLLDYAGSRIVMAEDEEQVDKLLEVAERDDDKPESPIRWIIYHDDRGMRKYDDPRLVSWSGLKERGEELARERPTLFEDEIASGRGEDIGILCTTSGTTSNPKLAMLAQKDFLTHLSRYLEADPREPTDEYVCMLPLPWIMEQVYVIGMPLLSRIRINFPESPETAMADMREIGPTHLLLAPRVWEQTAADMRSRILDAGPFSRWIFNACVNRGMRAIEKGRRSWIAELFLMGALRDRLGFSKVKSAATGGAATGPDTFKFFLAMGVPLRQLYGQTELTGAYTLQTGKEIDFDTSGIPFEDCKVRINDPDARGVGEIQTITPGMFKGYFRNEEATAETLTEDGWMRTGDAGFFDEKGRLTIIDRVKDIATTSQGDRFSPQFIENKLKFSPHIAEAVVFGHERPYLTAIICIRYSMVGKWAETNQIGFTNYQNLAANPKVYELLEDAVREVNATLPEAQRVRRFLLLYKELDPDDGELTRTRKVRRNVVDERYATLIAALYGDQDSVHVETEITFEDGRKGQIRADLVICRLDGATGDNKRAA